MKVAIIGAGIAGLSCAHELERNGIKATILEQNSFIGENYSHVGAILGIVLRPVKKPLGYLKNDLGLEMRPLNAVNKVLHISPHKTTMITGNLGYFFERSKTAGDIKVQIYSKLKNTDVLLNTVGEYEALSKKNDYVVVANGNFNYANELGCWINRLNAYVRGAVVLGDFDPTMLTVWVNKDYCKNGYAYLAPFDSKRASLVLFATEVSEKEVDHFWELFLYTENIRYPIIEEFKIDHRSGNVFPHRIENILLAGNAAGAIDPFLGFGIVNSILSGVMAARSIAKNRNYEALLKGMVAKNNQLYAFRKAVNKLDNAGYDKLFTAIGLPGIKQVTYHTPLNVIKLGSVLLNAKNNFKNGSG